MTKHISVADKYVSPVRRLQGLFRCLGAQEFSLARSGCAAPSSVVNIDATDETSGNCGWMLSRVDVYFCLSLQSSTGASGVEG